MGNTSSKDIDMYETLLLQKQRIIRENERYAFGENTIDKAPKKENPDNRINVPIGKSTVTDVVGYSGRPGELKTEYIVKPVEDEEGIEEEHEKTDDITRLLKSFDEHNKEGVENSELLTTSISLGMAWELWWTSDELGLLEEGILTPEYKIVDNKEVIPVYDGSLKPKMVKFLRYYSTMKGTEETKHCDIYYPKEWESYKRQGDLWVQVVPVDAEGNVKAQTYPYKKVPAIPFRSSMRNEPIFNAQKKLMDSYDSLLSKTQNEVDRFNAAIALFPFKVNKAKWKSISNALRPFFEDLDQYEKWPEYLNKDLNGVGTFYPAQADRLLNDYYRTVKVPDMSDENFAGNASGVALAYKLLGLEFIVSEIEVYFRPGLYQRFEFYKDIMNFSPKYKNVDWDLYEQIIIWNRNLPLDKELLLKMASMLQSLGYSDEAINRFIPSSVIEGKIISEEEIDDESDGDKDDID